MGAVSQTPQPVVDPLVIAALETERHVAAGGWDQPPRLFALVRTAELVEREPHLRAQLDGSDLAEGALTAVEQEGLPPTSTSESLLGAAGLAGPTSTGAALAVERIVVPPEAERDLPARPEAAVDALAAHPDRQDVRLLVAVLRDGSASACCASASTTATTRSPLGRDIAPGLVARAQGATLRGLSRAHGTGRGHVVHGGRCRPGAAAIVPRPRMPGLVRRCDDLDHAQPVGDVADDLVAVGGGREEPLRAAVAGADELLLDAADRADRAVAGRWCRCRRSCWPPVSAPGVSVS